MPRARDEPVRLTRDLQRAVGDAGETSLGDGSRVQPERAHRGLGAVDELNAALGVILAGVVPIQLRSVLERIQNELFDWGRLSFRPTSRAGCGSSAEWSIASSTTATTSTPISTSFEASSFRAGPRPLRGSTSRGRSVAAPSATPCVRRVSMNSIRSSRSISTGCGILLFILARAANALAGHDEPLWKPGATPG